MRERSENFSGDGGALFTDSPCISRQALDKYRYIVYNGSNQSGRTTCIMDADDGEPERTTHNAAAYIEIKHDPCVRLHT